MPRHFSKLKRKDYPTGKEVIAMYCLMFGISITIVLLGLK